MVQRKVRKIKRVRRRGPMSYHLLQLRINGDIFDELDAIARQNSIRSATTVARFAVLEFLEDYKNGKRVIPPDEEAPIENLRSSDEINIGLFAKTQRQDQNQTY